MKIERRDEVALLTMSAGKANAIGREWIASMESLVAEVARSDARALVVTGYGSFFSAGLDLPSLVDLSPGEMTSFMARFDAIMLGIFELPRPVIAAVNGHAIAGGCVLALQADERIMADSGSKIGLNEVVLGVGLPASAIEPLRCQVPASSLMPIALEGKLLAPREALALGLVHEVVPADAIVERALERAKKLAALPGPAFAHVKTQLRGPVAASIRAAWARGDATRWVETWTSPEGHERVRAAVAQLARKK